MMRLNNYYRRLFLVFITFILLACSKGLDISDGELVKRVSECLSDGNKTPGMAVSCGNYQKECTRRGKKTGNYIC